MPYYDQLFIDKEVIEEYFSPVTSKLKNEVYFTDYVKDAYFVKYKSKGKDKFVVIDSTDDVLNKNVTIGSRGNYAGFYENKKNVALHREIMSPIVPLSDIVHHKKHRFDNRTASLEQTTRLLHDQHRAYILEKLEIKMNDFLVKIQCI